MTERELLNKYVREELKEVALKKLKEGYPIQYIIGNVDFCGYPIKVDERVLIPRFETEYLVEKTIKYIKKLNINNPKILEIGTGSGCISIALKKNLECEIDAIDISKDAINLAKENAISNEVSINFINESIENYSTLLKYDVIISNPPYVKYNDEVANRLKYEPQNAIFAPNNGLYYYDVILNKLKNNISNNFLIAFEIDDKEGLYIKKLASKYLGAVKVYIEKDYNDLERYVFITKNKL